MMMRIAHNSRAHEGERGGEGGVWRNLRGGGGEYQVVDIVAAAPLKKKNLGGGAV